MLKNPYQPLLIGVVTQYKCVSSDYTRDPVSVTTNVYSHRTIPGVLVQDIKVYNPTDKPIQLSVEKLGIQMWDSAVSATKVIEHGEGGVKYSMVTGSVEVRDGNRTFKWSSSNNYQSKD